MMGSFRTKRTCVKECLGGCFVCAGIYFVWGVCIAELSDLLKISRQICSD